MADLCATIVFNRYYQQGENMLVLVHNLRELNFSALMAVYAEGNAENAEEFYPYDDRNIGILRAEDDFYQYLSQSFFTVRGAVYAIWQENDRYISALRLEPYRDGLLLEALETHPDYRRQGYAGKLILAVLNWLKEEGSGAVYSHINKRNLASLQTHLSCGFERISEQAVYIDGSVSGSSCTMRYQFQ